MGKSKHTQPHVFEFIRSKNGDVDIFYKAYHISTEKHGPENILKGRVELPPAILHPSTYSNEITEGFEDFIRYLPERNYSFFEQFVESNGTVYTQSTEEEQIK